MVDTKKDQLIARIENNYYDFKQSFKGVSRETLYNSADRIATVTDAYEYMKSVYEWDDEFEVEFFLLFKDPLTVVADAWSYRKADLAADIDTAIFEAGYSEDTIAEYPLIKGVSDEIMFIPDFGN